MDVATTTMAGAEILSWISQYGYFILLPLFIIEGASVGFTSGILISLGALEPLPIFLMYVIGTTITDTIIYFLAFNRSAWLEKIPILHKPLKRFDYLGEGNTSEPEWADRFRRHYFPIMILAKFAPLPASSQTVAAMAGVLKMPLRKVYPPIVIGQPFWSGIVIAAGYYLGDTIQNPAKLLNEAGVFTLIALVFLGLYYHYLHDHLKREFSQLVGDYRSGSPKV
jgi:membrane protein DedA with SNARE-associated domain